MSGGRGVVGLTAVRRDEGPVPRGLLIGMAPEGPITGRKGGVGFPRGERSRTTAGACCCWEDGICGAAVL